MNWYKKAIKVGAANTISTPIPTMSEEVSITPRQIYSPEGDVAAQSRPDLAPSRLRKKKQEKRKKKKK